jgi:hypothetical protein
VCLKINPDFTEVGCEFFDPHFIYLFIAFKKLVHFYYQIRLIKRDLLRFNEVSIENLLFFQNIKRIGNNVCVDGCGFSNCLLARQLNLEGGPGSVKVAFRYENEL